MEGALQNSKNKHNAITMYTGQIRAIKNRLDRYFRYASYEEFDDGTLVVELGTYLSKSEYFAMSKVLTVAGGADFTISAEDDTLKLVFC